MLSLIVLVAVSAFCLEAAVDGSKTKERLVRDLTKDYMANVDPNNSSLRFGLAIQCATFDALSGELTTHAWEKYFWNDARLVWDPKDYDNINVLRLPIKTFWRPDVKLYNSLRSDEDRSETHAVVASDGSLLWIPTVVYKTQCSSSDNGLNCSFRIGSWTYDAVMLPLTLDGTGVDLETYFNSTCPLLVESVAAEIKTIVYPCCKEPYSSVDITLKFRPRSA